MKAKINLPNIKGFIQAHYRQVLDEMGFLDDSTKEQWLYRIGIMSEECLQNKQCPCNCSVVEKQLEDRSCENNCYGPMLKSDDWEIFKQTIPIESIWKEANRRLSKYKIEL